MKLDQGAAVRPGPSVDSPAPDEFLDAGDRSPSDGFSPEGAFRAPAPPPPPAAGVAPLPEEDPPVEPPLPRGSIAGTLASVLLHLWLIATLAGVAVHRETRLDEPPIDSRIAEKEIPEEEEEIEYELANPEDRELEVREVVNAASVGLVQTDTPQIESPPTPAPDLVPDELRHKLYDLPQGLHLDERMVVKGTIGDAVMPIESALDRVTWEIATNLQERKVLVVWMLDASGSLEDQRQVLARRLRRIYGELDALERAEQIPRQDQPLLSAVVSYGMSTTFLTPEPTEKFEAVREAMGRLEEDPTGRENVFTAVCQVMDRWSSYRVRQGRHIMLVIVTDESGDDFDMHEPAIARCRRYGAKSYVIGPHAVFGRREGYVPYVAPEDGNTYRLPVDLGPETPVYEHVELPFWFDGPQLTYLSAGFPPYALARLVSETGGVYFTTNMVTMEGLSPQGVYDAQALKPFQPDYSFGTLAGYEKHLQQHPLRRAVVMAARLSRDNPAEGTPALDLRVTPQNFQRVASTAQEQVARSQFMIDTILQAFPPGIENELERETAPRWRMSFCLTYGRLLAQKVRCVEYNSALAHLKGSLSDQDVRTRSNHWIFRPDEDLNYAPAARRMAQTAHTLLNRILEEAPGTPWAVLAARELRHPFGIRIDERFIPPPTPRPMNNNADPNRPRLLLAPEPRNEPPQPPAPKPPPPKLPKL